jgi:hypothetical protein
MKYHKRYLNLGEVILKKVLVFIEARSTIKTSLIRHQFQNNAHHYDFWIHL